METSLPFLDLPDLSQKYKPKYRVAFLVQQDLIPLTLPISPLILPRFMSGSVELDSLQTDGRPTLLENQSLTSPLGDMRARPSSP